MSRPNLGESFKVCLQFFFSSVLLVGSWTEKCRFKKNFRNVHITTLSSLISCKRIWYNFVIYWNLFDKIDLNCEWIIFYCWKTRKNTPCWKNCSALCLATSGNLLVKSGKMFPRSPARAFENFEEIVRFLSCFATDREFNFFFFWSFLFLITDFFSCPIIRVLWINDFRLLLKSKRKIEFHRFTQIIIVYRWKKKKSEKYPTIQNNNA